MVCAFDRDKPARRSRGHARFVKLDRIENQRRQFGCAVGDVEPLVDGGQAKRRKSCDFLVSQLQRIVQPGVADRCEIVHAGNRQSRGDARVIECHCDEVGAG